MTPQPQLTFFTPVRTRGATMDAEFAAPVLETPTRELHGMVRGTDPIESQAAAVTVTKHTTAIQAHVLAALADHGPATAGQLEGRPEFAGLAPSTVRKRVSELSASGRIVRALHPDGSPRREDGMAVWMVADE